MAGRRIGGWIEEVGDNGMNSGEAVRLASKSRKVEVNPSFFDLNGEITGFRVSGAAQDNVPASCC